MTTNNVFLTANEVSEALKVSKNTAYKIIRNLNKELRKLNKIIIPVKISKRHFEEKIYL